MIKMKRIFCLVLIAASLQAQDVTTLLDVFNMVQHPPTNVLTITASQGDGTVCTAAKEASSTIYLALSCVSGKTAVKGTVLKSTDTAVSFMPFGYGDVNCLFTVNPVAPATVTWSCSTNIRTSGTVSGQTAIVQGSVSWP